MKTRILLALLLIGGSLAFAQASATLGNIIQLGRSTSANLPASSTTIQGAMLFDLDAGVPKYNTGSAWATFTSPSVPAALTSWTSDGGAVLTLGATDGGLLRVVSSNSSTIASVFVNSAIAAATYGYEPGPPIPFEVDAIRFAVVLAVLDAGTTQPVFAIVDDLSQTCSCTFPCNAASSITGYRSTCAFADAGTCLFAAAAPLTYSFSAIGDCKYPDAGIAAPTILGNITIEGKAR